MLDIVVTLFFAATAWRVGRGIWRESGIFLEFGQPRSLAFIVALFPLGPLVILFGEPLPLAAWLVAVACYLPAFIVSRRRIAAFERAGTDRVKQALSACSQAFGASIVGLVYIALIIVYVLVISTYAPSGA